MDKLIYPGKRLAVLAGDVFAPVWEAFFLKATDFINRAERLSIFGSYPVGLTITGVAATGIITISDHTRSYQSGDKDVTGGSVSFGGSYGSSFFLYYDDPTRQGGTVTYVSATTVTDAFSSATNPHRHYVGRVTTPASAGASNTTGTPAKPAGYA